MKPTLSHLALAIALAAMVGCEDQEARDRAALQAEMDAMAGGQVQQQLNSEEAELKKYLGQMQAQDPKIKDLYYSVDANGQKQLHVVREKEEEQPVEMIPAEVPSSAIAAGVAPQPTQQASPSSGVNDFVWGLAGGMTAAMLVNSFMNNGGMSGMTRSYPPSFSSYYYEEERRKRRNMATSGYVSYVNTTTRTRVASSPTFQAKKAAITSRSSSVFKSAGSTRASTYSFGG